MRTQLLQVLEVDERVTLVGYTSDPKAEEHQVQFDADGNVVRGYRGKGWDGVSDGEGPGKVVRGISGEAVRILKEPGESKLTIPSHLSTDAKTYTSCRCGTNRKRLEGAL